MRILISSPSLARDVQSMAPDSVMLSVLCHGLDQCGKDKLVMELCKEVEARRLMPEGFQKTGNILT